MSLELEPTNYVRARVAALRPTPLPAEELRAHIKVLLGNLDAWERPPMDVQVHESRQMDGYRRETITFTTRPGLTAYGYFLVPDGVTDPRPAVLAVPGHGRGADSIIGIAEDGSQRPLGAWDEYQNDYALQAVASGYPTLALEPISFGHRRRPDSAKAGPRGTSCHDDAMAALMLGETLLGWRVWDDMRALDYLQSRPEVDGGRLATVGISGGGTMSLFTAALDTRVTACVVSGYLNTFADSVLSIHHCVDNYTPGLSAVCEMPDVAALIAPRALYAESGDADPIFPLAGFERATAHLSLVYAEAGAADRFAFDVFKGGHQWSGKGVWPFLKQVLG